MSRAEEIRAEYEAKMAAESARQVKEAHKEALLKFIKGGAMTGLNPRELVEVLQSVTLTLELEAEKEGYWK